MDANLTADRNTYRTIRATALPALRMSAERFDEIARGIVLELSDGENMTPGMWISAARDVAAGRLCA